MVALLQRQYTMCSEQTRNIFEIDKRGKLHVRFVFARKTEVQKLIINMNEI